MGMQLVRASQMHNHAVNYVITRVERHFGRPFSSLSCRYNSRLFIDDSAGLLPLRLLVRQQCYAAIIEIFQWLQWLSSPSTMWP